jgi:cytochrome P450
VGGPLAGGRGDVSVDPATIDLTDLDRFAGGFPHEVFAWLRREAPVWWHAPTAHTPDACGFWVVSRHADVLHVFQDPATYSSEGGGARLKGGTFIADSASAGVTLNMMDDPRHARIRQLVNKGFTPRRIAGLEDELRRRTRRILDDAARKLEVDFVRDVARELPLQAICMLLGIPQDDRGALCDAVDVALEYQDRDLHQTTAASEQAFATLLGYSSRLVAQKRAEPCDDVFSAVIRAELAEEDPPRLTDAELHGFFVLLFAAGSETTRKAIAGGLRQLLREPEQLDRLRGAPALMETAVEEIVRFTTPSVYKRRTVTRDTELAGVKLREGDKVTVWEMSANHDERVFADPFRFDVARQPNPHVGFGFGVHYCLGANLARLEIRVMFEELLARFADIELAGDPVYTRDNRLFGLKRLPVRLR